MRNALSFLLKYLWIVGINIQDFNNDLMDNIEINIINFILNYM